MRWKIWREEVDLYAAFSVRCDYTQVSTSTWMNKVAIKNLMILTANYPDWESILFVRDAMRPDLLNII